MRSLFPGLLAATRLIHRIWYQQVSTSPRQTTWQHTSCLGRRGISGNVFRGATAVVLLSWLLVGCGGGKSENNPATIELTGDD